MSRRSVQNAHVVAESGIPELQAMVAADEVSVSAASTIATLPKRRQLELVARGSKSIARAAKRIKVRRGSRLKAKHKHNAKAASEDLGDEADERSHEPPAKIDDLGDPSVDEEDPQSCRVAFLLRTDLASNALRDCRVLMQRYEGKVGKSITTDISKAARAVATAWSALAFSLERAADGNAGSSEIVECDRVDSPEAA